MDEDFVKTPSTALLPSTEGYLSKRPPCSICLFLSLWLITSAHDASPKTLRHDLPMSKTLSTPIMRPMPATGSPTLSRTMANIIGPAPETPAVPMDASVAVRTMDTIWPNVRVIP